MSTPNLQGWLPFRIEWGDSGPDVLWCNAGTHRLLAPFYEDSIIEILRTPFNVLFCHRTPVDSLSDWQQQSPGIPPTGFIFHLSRCGSTLACQMLAAVEKNVVVSEAPPLDEMLRVAKLNGVSEETRIEWVRSMVSALGQQRAGGESQFFVKFDNWHALDLPLIRKAFPDVPWIFLFRDPIEILVSQVTTPAIHSFPGLMKFGVEAIDQMKAGLVTREEFCTRVLSHICEAALAALAEPGSTGIAVNYNELPEAMFTKIANHFRLAITPEDEQKMRDKTRFHAKHRSLTFENDSQQKQDDATPAVREACAKWMSSVYDRLLAATI